MNIKLIDGVFLGPYYSYYSGFNNTIFKNGISTIGVTGGIDLDISWGGIKGYSNNTIQGELFDKQNSYTKAKWSLLSGMAFTGIATTFLVFAHIFFVEGFIYTEGDEMSVALAKFLTPVTLGISMASAGIAIPLYTHYYKVNH